MNQKLPFEKLIDNGSFADIDELAELYKSDIDFDDYNSTIMDCGIYNGKRYIIPIAYCPNILITTQEILDKYNLENTNFSFKELEIRLSDKDHSYALLEIKMKHISSSFPMLMNMWIFIIKLQNFQAMNLLRA